MDNEKCPLLPGKLIDVLIQQYNEGNQVGLVKDDNNPDIYYYKDTNEEVSNNYLWYGGHHWRILEFNVSKNSITLISQQPLTSIQFTKTVWKDENEYNTTFINSWLNEYFINTLDNDVKNNINDSMFNIGPYNNVSEIVTNKKVGLLDFDQYERVGGYNSFLTIKDYFWLGNYYDSTNISVIKNDGNMFGRYLVSSLGVRPVIYLNLDVLKKILLMEMVLLKNLIILNNILHKIFDIV